MVPKRPLPTHSLVALILAAALAAAASAASTPGKVGENPFATGEDPARLATRCALLDDAEKRPHLDGLLTELLYVCGRFEELGRVVQEEEGGETNPEASTDARVNDVTGETGTDSRVQNETALAYNEATGTICSGFNDSYSGVTLSQNFTGFSRSTDGGATWADGGQLAPPVGQRSFGDPAIVWRKSDAKFYMAALHSSGGLGFWRSDDDCLTFTWVGLASPNTQDDKELLSVDNTIASPYYGRIYLAWTDFNLPGTQIVERHTDNGGGVWTAQQSISSALGGAPQGAWPAVSPDGKVYVAWVDRASNADISMQVVRSNDGGGAWSAVAVQPAVNVVNPRDAAASSTCGRTALNGNIRYLPSPQIAVGPDLALHIVYTRDPNAQGTGDASNVYYRRSTTFGDSWGPEVQLNDDVTLSDQFFAALSVGSTNFVGVGWYDRREDPANIRYNYYAT
ncbi:MAG: sialidase family protein, partial [Thermoanaerobaculia bacterium]